MVRNIKQLSEYLRSIQQVEVAESLKQKTFVDNAFLTQYINGKCGRSLKSENWTRILQIINN